MGFSCYSIVKPQFGSTCHNYRILSNRRAHHRPTLKCPQSFPRRVIEVNRVSSWSQIDGLENETKQALVTQRRPKLERFKVELLGVRLLERIRYVSGIAT